MSDDKILNPRTGLWLSNYKYRLRDNTDQLQHKINQTLLSQHRRVPQAVAPITGDLGEYQVDLMFVNLYAKFNGGNKVILNLVNVPTRFLYSKLLKNKSQAAQTLIELIPTLNPPMTRLRLDAGTEFLNKTLSDFLQSNNITVDIVNKNKSGDTETLSSFSLAIVERVNKTVRDLIERYITTSKQTGMKKYQYQNVFNDLIANYNNSPHAELKMTPQEALTALTHQLPNLKTTKQKFDSDYVQLRIAEAKKMQRQQQLQLKIQKNFPLNSYVRILAGGKKRFEKSSVAKFSEALYKVIGHIGYRLKLEAPDGSTTTRLYHQVTAAAAPTKAEPRPEPTQPHPEPTESAPEPTPTREKLVRYAKRTRHLKQALGFDLDSEGNPIIPKQLQPKPAAPRTSTRPARTIKKPKKLDL